MISGDYVLEGAGVSGAFFAWFMGNFDGVFKLLIAMAIIDQITGLLKASVKGTWSSDAGFHGIAKKVLMFLLVGIANIIDHELLGHSEVLRDAVCLFYVANEGISIMENAIELGAPVPDALKEKFMVWHNRQLTSKNEPDPEDNG